MRESQHLLRRRGVLALGIGAFVLAVAPFARRGGERLVRRRVPLMGTLAEIVVVGDDERAAQLAIDAALYELRLVNGIMSRFRSDSDVGRANLHAAAGPVAVRPATAAVLTEALRWAHATDGAFDPCVGRAVELWDVTERSAPPPRSRVRRLAGRSLYRALELDARRGSPVVRFADADVALDLGGIAKGYAVDRAAAALRTRGVRDGLVNVGGDLLALGTSSDGDPWRVGVRSPHDPSRLVGRIDVRDAAVATSGDYEQFFDHAGRRYHHLLDPVTGEPRASHAHSLTVVADSCMTADAAATAVFGAEPQRARDVLRRSAPGARIVEET